MPAAEPTPPPPPPPQHALGVLLVHGIGEQKQGETLNEFGAPIIKWLDQWLTPDQRNERLKGPLARHVVTKDVTGSASFTRGMLRPPDLPLDTPAHATATIRKEVEGTPPVDQSWLFAESWWSPQTLPPRVSPFLLWLITRGPWILLMHLSQRFGVDYAAMTQAATSQSGSSPPNLGLQWRLAKFVAVTLLWLVISLFLIGLWCVVSLIALVPIGYVRQRVYDLLLAITGVIGDSYVLINDPIQRVAFGNTTRRGIAWLHEQGCGKVAVVAHSQGAAVARDVLFAAGAPPVDLFVTLGPGIAKLDALAERERRAPFSFLWSGAAAPLTFVAVVLLVRSLLAGHTGFALVGFPSMVGIVALAATFISWSGVADSLERLQPDALQVALMRNAQPDLRWQDFYASHDPVSNGSLSSTVGARFDRIVSERVMVLASALKDHTAYWTSRADFVPRVARALEACAGAGLFATAAGVQRIDKARRLHSHAVQLLRVLRWAGIVALVLPLRRFGAVQAVAADLRATIDALPVESLVRAVSGLQAGIGWMASLVAGEDLSGEGITSFLLLALTAAVLLHVWGRIVAYWWHQLDTLLLAPVFAPSGRPGSLIAQGLLFLLVLLLGLLPLLLAAGWAFWPDEVSWRTLDTVLAQFATLVFMLLYGGVLALLLIVTPEAWREFRTAFQAEQGVWAGLKAGSSLLLLPGAWLVYGAGGAALLSANRYAMTMLPWAAGIVAVTSAVAWLLWRRRRA